MQNMIHEFTICIGYKCPTMSIVLLELIKYALSQKKKFA